MQKAWSVSRRLQIDYTGQSRGGWDDELHPDQAVASAASPRSASA